MTVPLTLTSTLPALAKLATMDKLRSINAQDLPGAFYFCDDNQYER